MHKIRKAIDEKMHNKYFGKAVPNPLKIGNNVKVADNSLATLHPTFAQMILSLIKNAKIYLGVEVYIREGFRTRERQQYLSDLVTSEGEGYAPPIYDEFGRVDVNDANYPHGAGFACDLGVKGHEDDEAGIHHELHDLFYALFPGKVNPEPIDGDENHYEASVELINDNIRDLTEDDETYQEFLDRYQKGSDIIELIKARRLPGGKMKKLGTKRKQKVKDRQSESKEERKTAKKERPESVQWDNDQIKFLRQSRGRLLKPVKDENTALSFSDILSSTVNSFGGKKDLTEITDPINRSKAIYSSFRNFLRNNMRPEFRDDPSRIPTAGHLAGYHGHNVLDAMNRSGYFNEGFDPKGLITFMSDKKFNIENLPDFMSKWENKDESLEKVLFGIKDVKKPESFTRIPKVETQPTGSVDIKDYYSRNKERETLSDKFPKHDIVERGQTTIQTNYYDPNKRQGLFDHIHGAQVQSALDMNKEDSYATPVMDSLRDKIGENNPLAQMGRSVEQGIRGSTQGLRNIFGQMTATRNAINRFKSQDSPSVDEFPGLNKDIGI